MCLRVECEPPGAQAARSRSRRLSVICISSSDPTNVRSRSVPTEHLLFTGSRHTHRDDDLSHADDALPPAINATTSADATTYYQVVPRENLERIPWPVGEETVRPQLEAAGHVVVVRTPAQVLGG